MQKFCGRVENIVKPRYNGGRLGTLKFNVSGCSLEAPLRVEGYLLIILYTMNLDLVVVK